ncbi:MAG TPA: ParB/RepB/Spo0J family partition protein [Candidatus Pacearchaeota archaeon]|jgi:ParB family chromosome partitioning protein|nr:ParB/RepB/Spo0J family partition protein [Candidatus Pacearchaeota archaeon]HRR94678.1 ParB/RepB/Spo0J family partition protein [Candidatus Paceibacterota bacterium]HPC30358.1 ParB/RepB/Spo0J family partition protein [Candidatus Pacearchaeota archaeon]HQG09171.1 ParB/RepB/Spo0J family partition protein [Candidatus Pacearchaeota archaeon]HQH20397.1 ParB/RepB/Spo0J family partition protein [Candidatus Pacearchaeota archaeon]
MTTTPKGLESLIPKKKANQSITSKTSQKDFIFWIDINKIKPNPYQPRKEFNEEELNALADSIRKYGVLQPIIVHRIEKKNPAGGAPLEEYQIIAGERRWRASQIAGLKQMPAIIKTPNNREKLEIALIENVQRKNLNPIDKAEAFDQLRKEFNLLEKEIAQVAGISREAVANSLRLLALPPDIINALKKEKITEGHAKSLLSVRDENLQRQIFNEILENNYSVRDVEKAAKAGKVHKRVTSEIVSDISNKELLESKIKEAIDYDNIKLNFKRGKLHIDLEFNTEGELKNWLKKLMHR